jgi:protein-tyrosine phosphatase/membrane-associated phospholipid phosphatase
MGNVHSIHRAESQALGERVRPTFAKAAAVSAGLSLLFVVVYGGCNWITAQRSDVGLLNFEWESHIPFVPRLIAPYLSIDLFFVAAPFLCRTGRELSTFTKRVILAIIAAGICFLLFPFRFAFPPPHASGWIGAIFDWFRGMDAPYNLFPSLHVALCLLLAHTYARHTRGTVRAALIVWFVLIGLSAVLTYQHHVLDVVGGAALAGYCFYFVRDSSPRLPVTTNRRIGFYYAAGALTFGVVAFVFWPSGALLLWPGIAFLIATSGYFRLGPLIYRKSEGLLPISTLFTLGPCLAGQHLSLLYYRRQCQAWDQVTPQVWVGRLLRGSEASAAMGAGVKAVLDLAAEFSEAKPFREICYRNVPILDLTAPTIPQLSEMADFIDEYSQNGVVYVHCKIGYSRSAAAVAAWLLKTGKVSGVEGALTLIRRARPSVVIRPEIISALQRWNSTLRSGSL